jgi:hypothetical protein
MDTLVEKRFCLCCDRPLPKRCRPGQKFISRKHAVRYAVALHWHRTHKDYHSDRKIKVVRVVKCSRCKRPFEITLDRSHPNPKRIRFCKKCREQNDMDTGRGKPSGYSVVGSLRALIRSCLQRNKYVPTAEIVSMVNAKRKGVQRENIHVVLSRMFLTYKELDRCGKPPLCMYRLRAGVQPLV